MLKKYIYCTIAINQSYIDYAIKFANQLYEKSPNTKVLIVSDIDNIDLPNVIYHKIPEHYKTKLLMGNIFNYNLKFYPILKSLEENYEYIIFKDCDWEIYDGYSDEKLDNLISVFEESGYDCFFERPYSISSKYTDKNCIFKHKIDIYNLMETDKYDKGVVPIEQFFLFKNSPKLKIFCDKWAEREKIISDSNIHPWAEGLEIGMSLIDADMTHNNSRFTEISNCFKFDSYGNKHTRY